jgi:hypothetical protein
VSFIVRQRGVADSDMKYRFYYSDWGGGHYQPRIWCNDVVERDVQAVLTHAGEDFPGFDDVRVKLGQIRRGERYLRVIYVPEPQDGCVFVLAAWRLRGAELQACRTRQRGRGCHNHLRPAPETSPVITSLLGKSAPEPYPSGWDEQRVQRVIAHYERQQDSEAQIAEDEAAARCLSVNPFGLVRFSPSWCTTTSIAIARQMEDSCDFSAMPILADALQDAGCDDESILDHCRGPGPHCRGCWVVDLVLGKA